MSFFTLFQFLTRLLTTKHLKLFSTYLLGRNETMWKTSFLAPQIPKKKISRNIKTKCITKFLLTVRSSCMKVYNFITWWAHKRKTFTLISIKITRNWKSFVYNNRVFKHKEVVSNLHVCSNGLGKMWPSYTLHFSTRILNSTHSNVFNIFFA